MRVGLIGLLIVGGLVYYSGAGGKISEGLVALEGGCYEKLGTIASGKLTPACKLVGGAGRGLDGFSGMIGSYASQVKTAVMDRVIGASKRSRLIEYNAIMASDGGAEAVQSFGSSATELTEKIKHGPQGVAADTAEQLRSAMDSFAIGRQYLSGGGSVSDAMPWLQQGAAMPDYGVLSQIQLGDVYAQGAGGMAPNPELAAGYYAQASQSISNLQASGSAEAKQILQSLHGTPQEVQRKLQLAIAQLKTKR